MSSNSSRETCVGSWGAVTEAGAERRWPGSMSTGAPAVATAYAGTKPSASRMRR